MSAIPPPGAPVHRPSTVDPNNLFVRNPNLVYLISLPSAVMVAVLVGMFVNPILGAVVGVADFVGMSWTLRRVFKLGRSAPSAPEPRGPIS